jgi:hypothetical protein
MVNVENGKQKAQEQADEKVFLAFGLCRPVLLVTASPSVGDEVESRSLRQTMALLAVNRIQ